MTPSPFPRWRSLSHLALATILFRVITGLTLVTFGAAFTYAHPTTGAAAVFYERAGMFYNAYVAAFLVCGAILTLAWRLHYWYFVGLTTPLFGYFAISVYAVAVGRVSFQGITLFVSMIALWVLLLALLRDEIGGAK
jgi:hypothetical protein